MDTAMRAVFKAIRFGTYTTITASLFLLVGSKAFAKNAASDLPVPALKSQPLELVD